MSNQFGANVAVSPKATVRNCILEAYARLKDYAEISDSHLGEYSYLAQYSIANKTEIGKFCSIGHGAYVGLWEHNTVVTTHSFYLYETSGGFVKGFKSYDKCAVTTHLGNDVWIGANAVVLKGRHIGDGAIVGAGAVVTKDVPPYAIVVGNPARVVKYRFDAANVDFLCRLKWWDFPRELIQEMVDLDLFRSIEAVRKFAEERSLLA